MVEPTQRRRRWFQFSMATMLVVVALVALATAAVMTKSSRRLYDAIEPGMTIEQAVEICGSEGDFLGTFDWIDVEHVEDRADILQNPPRAHEGRREWTFGDHRISVTLGRDGRIVCKYYQRATKSGVITKILDRLGL